MIVLLRFYDVKEEYINYLKKYDKRLPNVTYSTNNKFVCGIVLTVNGKNYYAPISHFNKRQRTNFPIIDHGKIIATIRFCFMVPVPSVVLKEKNFKLINKADPKYADLLKTEYDFCKQHIEEIKRKAQSVYKIGTNPNHEFYNTCCDFKVLEDAYETYIQALL